jgi:integrase
MLVLAYCAGLRIGEIARLTVGDIDIADQTIEIRETKFFNYAASLTMLDLDGAIRKFKGINKN